MNEQAFDAMRRAMVASQLRTTGVSDPHVIAAIGAVPREAFVTPGRRALAYADVPVPLGNGRVLNNAMVLGRLLTEARPRPGERALVIGAATGYSVAVLQAMALDVVALEEDAGLAAAARAALDGGGALVEGPLARGWPAAAPYDLILIDGAVEGVPDAVVHQLRDGGRLVCAILERGVSRLAIGRRAGDGFGLVTFADAEMAPLPGFARPKQFSF